MMDHVNLEACRRTVELLPWRANGSLGDAENQQVARHLEECAACRREAAFLKSVVGNMPEPRATRSGAAPFSRLLQRINRRERRMRQWKIAAAVLVTFGITLAIALPAWLFEPRFQAVTEPLSPAGTVQLRVAFDENGNLAALADVLERHEGDIVAGLAPDGSFIIEFRLARGGNAAELIRRLEMETQVKAVRQQAEQRE